jgi:hypothetical protein
MRRAQRGDRLDPQIAPHAMLDMHHQIAGRQRVDLAQEVLGLALAAGLCHQPVAQHILFGNHRQTRGDETRLQRPDHQEQPALALGQVAEIGDLPRAGQPVVGQKALQPLARAIGPGGDHHLTGLRQNLNMIGQGTEKIDLLLLPLWREIAPARAPASRTPGPGLCGRAKAAPRDGRQPPPPRPHRPDTSRPPEPACRPCRSAPWPPSPHGGRHSCRRSPPSGTAAPPSPDRPARPRHPADSRTASPAGMEERQPMLHPLMLAPRADRLVQGVIRPRRAKADPVVLPEPGNRRLVEDHLGNR